jgi:hypothetical protein
MMLLGTAAAELPSEVVASWPLLPGRELHPTVPGRPQSTAGATVATLDDALDALEVQTVDLIKLDVDGYECDVLDGAGRTLARHRPTLLVELAPFLLETAGGNALQLFDRLCGAGYTLHRLRGSRRVDADDVRRLARDNASMNVIAQPG